MGIGSIQLLRLQIMKVMVNLVNVHLKLSKTNQPNRRLKNKQSSFLTYFEKKSNL